MKYGATTDHVLSVEFVMPDGEVLVLGHNSGYGPGYDLVGVVTGSEGTLGIVTEVTVKLLEVPEGIETLLAIFPDVVSACRAVMGIVGSGMVPAALEIIDRRTIQVVEDSVYRAGLPRTAGAVEADGVRFVDKQPRVVRGREIRVELKRRVRAIRRVDGLHDDPAASKPARLGEAAREIRGVVVPEDLKLAVQMSWRVSGCGRKPTRKLTHGRSGRRSGRG